MNAIGWVSVGLSATAIVLSGYSVWQLRRTIRLTRERIARAEAKRRGEP